MPPISTATLSLQLPGVAFVTGGGSGLGRSACLAFADLGAKIAVADINQTAAKEVADIINKAYPQHAIAVHTDVTDEASVKSAIEQTVSAFGRIDYAINSAGLVVGGAAVTEIKDTPIDEYEKIQRVDGRGVFLCTKYEMGVMMKQSVAERPRASRGVIINIASRASLEGVPKFGSYCAAKHAVLGISRVAAVEGAPHNIRCIAMCPGLITTPGHVKAAKEVDDMLLAKVPMKRFGVPDEITDGLTFLCSDMASFMTGCTFEIDGGCAAI